MPLPTLGFQSLRPCQYGRRPFADVHEHIERADYREIDETEIERANYAMLAIAV